jgi:hypothetical protein
MRFSPSPEEGSTGFFVPAVTQALNPQLLPSLRRPWR